jgi:hypothetical protein
MERHLATAIRINGLTHLPTEAHAHAIFDHLKKMAAENLGSDCIRFRMPNGKVFNPYKVAKIDKILEAFTDQSGHPLALRPPVENTSAPITVHIHAGNRVHLALSILGFMGNALETGFHNPSDGKVLTFSPTCIPGDSLAHSDTAWDHKQAMIIAIMAPASPPSSTYTQLDALLKNPVKKSRHPHPV